jgi:hypothetical protein
MSKTVPSSLTPSGEIKNRAWCRKKARELRGLRRELREEWGDLVLTLKLMIETLEEK